MLKVFIFVITILTNEGELQMKAMTVKACPDETAFSQTMDQYVTDKKMLAWNAICIPPQGDA